MSTREIVRRITTWRAMYLRTGCEAAHAQWVKASADWRAVADGREHPLSVRSCRRW